MAEARYACQIQLPYFDDDVRAILAAGGITESFAAYGNVEPDSTEPTNVRVIVPADSETDAQAALIRALHRFDWQRVSPWHRLGPGEP